MVFLFLMSHESWPKMNRNEWTWTNHGKLGSMIQSNLQPWHSFKASSSCHELSENGQNLSHLRSRSSRDQQGSCCMDLKHPPVVFTQNANRRCHTALSLSPPCIEQAPVDRLLRLRLNLHNCRAWSIYVPICSERRWFDDSPFNHIQSKCWRLSAKLLPVSQQVQIAPNTPEPLWKTTECKGNPH